MEKGKKNLEKKKLKDIMFKQMPDENSNLIIYIWAALIPIAIMLITTILLKINPFGEGSYLIVDMAGQYTSFFSYLRTLILENGNNIFYSFSKTIGGDIYGLYTYYLISPINLIFILFSSSNIPYAVMLIIFIKIGLAGLTFNMLITRGKNNYWKSLIFSTSYALMAYSVSFCYNVMWLDAVYLLPLIIIGVDKILENKSPLMYIICLTLTLIFNYYIGFMVCIFIGIYFIYKLLLKKDKLQRYITKTVIFLIISLIAVGISAIVLLPSFRLIQEGRATFDFEILKFESNFKFMDIFSKFYTYTSGGSEVQNGGMPHVFCGIIINLLLITYFLNKKIDIREKILSSIVLGILLISFHVNTFNLIWHGLNNPAWFYYRYSYVFSFMCIMLAHRSFENLESGISIKEIIKTLLIFFIITIFVENKEYEYVKFIWLYFDVALFAIYSYLIYCYIKNKNNESKKAISIANAIIILIIIINSLNLLLNAKYTIEDIQNGVYSTEYYQNYQVTMQEIIDNVKSQDSSFYRIEKDFDRSLNDAMQLNYNGISHSSSTYQLDTNNFLEKLGMQKKDWFINYNKGSTEAADCLLGVKYLLNKEETSKDYIELFKQDVVTVYENMNALNLAYAVENSVKNINMNSTNTFEIQNEIYKKITGENKNIFSKEENYEIETENLIVNEKDSETTYIKQDEETEGSIIYNIKVTDNKNLYFYVISNENEKADINIKSKNYMKKYGTVFDTYSTEMIDLGKHNIGDEIKVEIKPEKTTFTIKDVELYYEDTQILKEYCDKLKDEQVNLEKISSSHLQGTVNINEKNKYILFTIPYSDGWTIKVDGEEVETYEVMESLLAIKIPQGEHKIDMKYMPTGFKLGMAISIISIFAMISILIIDKKSIKNH